ncbi:deformed epidermal autoregulatory factor 1 homolog isoform X2 [Uloborus diversus]|nr:deformed epidermal autoregulatory factor 1 homolog isoform X2 [Uloborus diversus]
MEIGLSDEEIPNERSVDVENAISGIPDDPDREVCLDSDSERALVTVTSMPPNVLVSTTTANLFADQESFKATRIIIHEPPSLEGQQTITFNALNRSLSVPEKHFNWDPSVYNNVLPVRCKNVRGELHKSRFGSGRRGRSILVDGTWYTPSEFEALCGRGNSKDWKRSIRYAGRTLMCLIEEGILRPHATACTCAACFDDFSGEDGPADTMSGPVRLFTPYKRKRRAGRPKLKVCTRSRTSDRGTINSAPVELQPEDLTLQNTSTDALTTITVPLIPRNTSNPIIPNTESVIVTPAATPQTPGCAPTALDFSEQRHWWKLEEMVKNAVRQVSDLQKHVEVVKSQSAIARQAALNQLRIQMEKEKNEALTALRMEADVALSQAILEAKVEKDAAVEEAVQKTRQEMQQKIHSLAGSHADSYKLCANCNREAVSKCTGCHRVSYCSAFCQRRDWRIHRDDCCENVLTTADECAELVDDCDDPTS